MSTYSDISPRYVMTLVAEIEERLWLTFDSAKYRNIELYIKRWQEWEYGTRDGWNSNYSDFEIIYKNDKIDLLQTLHQIPNEKLVKIAIDLNIDTPPFLPSIPVFKNILKDNNQSAYQNFERAIQNVYDNPDESIALASSTLEGIIKTILGHEKININTANCSLAKLVGKIVQELGLNSETCPQEVKTIACSLRTLGKTVDDLRSDKTTAHGKTDGDYIAKDPLWAMLIVNTSATLGLFLWDFFVNKFKPAIKSHDEADMNLEPIDLSDIPF